ncbi:unnamed protein product [Lepeophtheirus salmonis]|nr:unnamed protein product [Lepeophtheirus salmonis]CAF2749107.1 unnamed protein product [Lepeophtheirus salmonis]
MSGRKWLISGKSRVFLNSGFLDVYKNTRKEEEPFPCLSIYSDYEHYMKSQATNLLIPVPRISNYHNNLKSKGNANDEFPQKTQITQKRLASPSFLFSPRTIMTV